MSVGVVIRRFILCVLMCRYGGFVVMLGVSVNIVVRFLFRNDGLKSLCFLIWLIWFLVR